MATPLLLSEASVTAILSKWLQDFKSLGNHCTSQLSHLLLYLSLWLPGLSSQCLPLFPLQPSFEIGIGQNYLWEMAKKFCKLREPLHRYITLYNTSYNLSTVCTVHTHIRVVVYILNRVVGYVHHPCGKTKSRYLCV